MNFSLKKMFVGALLLVPLWFVMIMAYGGETWAMGALSGFCLRVAAAGCSWLASGVFHLLVQRPSNGDGVGK